MTGIGKDKYNNISNNPNLFGRLDLNKLNLDEKVKQSIFSKLNIDTDGNGFVEFQNKYGENEMAKLQDFFMEVIQISAQSGDKDKLEEAEAIDLSFKIFNNQVSADDIVKFLNYATQNIEKPIEIIPDDVNQTFSVRYENGDEIKYVTEAVMGAQAGAEHIFIERAEEEIARYINVSYAVALNSCTAALHLALKLAAEKLYGSATGLVTPKGVGIGGCLKGKKVFWFMHDMFPITGGCHYSFECGRYVQNCGECPCLKHSGKYDFSYKQLKYKCKTLAKYKNFSFQYKHFLKYKEKD
mgnify:CR=1 FL=1